MRLSGSWELTFDECLQAIRHIATHIATHIAMAHRIMALALKGSYILAVICIII
jgi:hypothetical protein